MTTLIKITCPHGFNAYNECYRRDKKTHLPFKHISISYYKTLIRKIENRKGFYLKLFDNQANSTPGSISKTKTQGLQCLNLVTIVELMGKDCV